MRYKILSAVLMGVIVIVRLRSPKGPRDLNAELDIDPFAVEISPFEFDISPFL
jgi:hypothetical protein